MMIKRFYATVLLLTMMTSVPLVPAKAEQYLRDGFIAASNPSPLPDLLLKDGAGQDRNLHQYLKDGQSNRFLLLVIWATWCEPCRAEMPSLDRLQTLIGSNRLFIVALAQDYDGLISVPAYYRRHKIANLPLFSDSPGNAMRMLNLNSLPTSILVDPQGMEVGRIIAPLDWADPDNVAALKEIMALRNGRK